MSARSKAIIGMLSMAALGTWWGMYRGKRSTFPHNPAVELDDDAIADVIRRARPSLERARALLFTEVSC